ncbi:hypothetical protein [Psychroflexus tropicus]|uniref:hypothetical protein n=1 Tax=Psychroflexus tropicus TaxID=197345 RepID=UPI00035C76AC|nr:hypothetical protein [Psychroflexus tropicus]
MKSIFLLLTIFLCSAALKAQDNNKIETIAIIEILNDTLTVIDQDTVPLSSVYKKVNQVLEANDLSNNIFPSITLITNPSVTENSIENIKYQIRSTPIQLINLQRKIITNYDGVEINQNVLDQYNALINYWNSLTPDNRFYRETDLKFVQSVALNMSLNQRIRNKKLPGYLPFVKEEAIVGKLSMLEKKSDLDYKYIYDKDTLHANQLASFEDYSYRLKRRIIDEEKIIIIELSKN